MSTVGGNGNGNGRSIQIVGIIVTVVTSVFAAFGALAYFAIQNQISSQHELFESQREDDQKELVGLSGEVKELKADAITHAEHAALIDRIMRLELTIGNTYPLGDVMKDIQIRLQKVEERSGHPQTQAQP